MLSYGWYPNEMCDQVGHPWCAVFLIGSGSRFRHRLLCACDVSSAKRCCSLKDELEKAHDDFNGVVIDIQT